VSEIYGSGGYDRRDSGDRSSGDHYNSDADGMWGDQDPDAANYADLDHPDSQDDHASDDDDSPDADDYRHRDEELDGDMNRAEYADYVRNREQAGIYDADGDCGYDTAPDAENYADANTTDKPHGDQVDGHDADIYSILHENDDLPEPRTRQEAAADTWDQPDQIQGGPLTQDRYADQTVETEDALRQRVADLESANAELETQNTQLGRGMAELKSENSELGKSITELRSENADLKRGVSALEARMERLEHNNPGKPVAVDTGRELDSADRAEKKGKQQAGRGEWTSNEAITASVLGVGATAVALSRKHREARNEVHRPEH
jgi:cell division protein FtsB